VVSTVFHRNRALIEEELMRRNRAFLAELRGTSKPTNDQSEAVVDVLSDALRELRAGPCSE
jgi:hypothetical protein